MYTEEDLSSAVEAGILTPEQVAAFQAHAASLESEPAIDEEHFRLISGFNDIFVVIACLLLLASVAWIGAASTPWLGALAVSGVAWFLAEFFTLKRRMALPAIVLLLAFVGGIVAAGISLADNNSRYFFIAGIVGALAAWLHWLRFRVPITVAAGAGAAVGGAISLLFAVFPETKYWATPLSFAAGVIVFVLAMRWDATDPERRTRRSDVAFWLHLLAAPLLVHPVFATLGVFNGQTTLGQAIAVIALYVVMALISLSIDRRALMVSALIYVLYTFSALLKQYGVVSLSFAITALVIGSALLLLSAFWHTSRAYVVGFLPLSLRVRLPGHK